MPSLSDCPVPRQPRYRTLDIWRGVACLLVLLIHATRNLESIPLPIGKWWSDAGQVVVQCFSWICANGVPIFFVISGYCISATADATWRKPRPSANYFKRRFRRIYPPYWAVIGTLVICGGLWY